MTKLLTFDIWDTVLRRRCHPDVSKVATSRILLFSQWQRIKPNCRDLLRLTEERVHCEVMVGQRNGAAGGDEEYLLDKVLSLWVQRSMQESLPETELERLVGKLSDAELQHEEFVSYVDPGIVEFLSRFPHEKALFVSDFYMPADRLSHLLQSARFGFPHEGGFVSCECGVNKRSGRLFSRVESAVDAAPENHIHVGDSKMADIRPARRLGIKAVHYGNAREHAKRVWNEKAHAKRVRGDVRAYWQQQQELLRQEVHAPDGLSSEQKRLFVLGRGLSPLFFAFVQWIMERAVSEGLGTVYYFAREGELLRLIHEAIREEEPLGFSAPRSRLLEVSRMATFAASLSDVSVRELKRFWTMYPEHSLQTLAISLNMDPQLLGPLAGRHGLEVEADLHHPWTMPAFRALMEDSEFRDVLLDHVYDRRARLLAYLASMDVVDRENQRYAVVDIGWRGTIQDNIARVLRRGEFLGLYLGLLRFINPQPANGRKEAYLVDENLSDEDLECIRSQAALEMVFNSPQGSVTGYSDASSESVALRLADASESRIHEEYTRYLQEGILAAVPCVARHVRTHALTSIEMRGGAKRILQRLVREPHPLLARAYFELHHNETFGHGRFIPRQGRLNLRTLSRVVGPNSAREELRAILDKSGWPEACLVQSGLGTVNAMWSKKRDFVGSPGRRESNVGLFAARAKEVVRVAKSRSRRARDIGVVGSLREGASEFLVRNNLRALPPVFDLVRRADLSEVERSAFNRSLGGSRSFTDDRQFYINWVIPDVGFGSGGHRTILRIASHFEAIGLHNRFFVFGRSEHETAEGLAGFVASNYAELRNAEFHTTDAHLPDSDLLIATSWQTAYRVFLTDNTRFKAYLIQDYEPLFFPVGADHQFAENTYRMNLYGMCASRWLHSVVTDRFGMDACHFDLGVDQDTYKVDDYADRDPDLVAVYIRPSTPRRGLELILAAVANLVELRPETRIAFFGADHLGYEDVPFRYEILGLLPEERLAGLYNRSAVCLLTSLTNYSLLPMEIMACGAVVVDVAAPSMRGVFSETDPIVLARPEPWAMARAMAGVLDDARRRDEIVRQAFEYVRTRSWEAVLSGLENRLFDAYLGPERLNSHDIPEGALVRARGTDRIYVVENGEKRYIPSLDVFNERRFSFDAVNEVAPRRLLAMRNGPVVS